MGGCSGGSCSSGSCSDGSCSSGDNDRLPPGMLRQYDLNQDTGLGALIWLDNDGKTISKECISLLGRIRKASDDRIFAMITGPADIRPLYDIAFSYGVDTLYHIRCKEMEQFNADNYAKAMADLARRINPMCIMVTADEKGNAMTSKVGVLLNRHVHLNCTSFTYENNLLKVEGSQDESIPLFSKSNVHPIIATIQSNGFETEPIEGRKGTAISRPFKV